MRIVKLTVAALLVFGSQSALAIPLSFDWTDGTDTVSWVLDSNPVPDVVAGNRFEMLNVTVSFNGVDTLTSAIRFFTSGSGGGFNISSVAFGLFPNTFGPELYAGSLAMPVFSPGTFDLTGGSGDSTLTISNVAVPEPAMLALLGIGLLGMGLARSKRA